MARYKYKSRDAGWIVINDMWNARLAGIDCSAKDFRTWHATVLAAVELAGAPHRTASGAQRAINKAVRQVANQLGNTPAVCRSSYIDPRVIDLYDDGTTIAAALERLGADADFGQPATHGQVEAAVLRLLKKPAKAAARRRATSPAQAKAA